METSNDSDTTVAYDVNISRPGRFSPLPSTSQDNDIIHQNEMRFNASLVSKGSPKQNLPLKQNLSSRQSLSPIQIFEDAEQIISCSKQVDKLAKGKPVTVPETETIVIDDEDDCLIAISNKEHKETRSLPSPIELDDGYTIAPYNEDSLFNVSDISVDDVIAENSSILKKYSKKTPITVTEVPPVQNENQIINEIIDSTHPAHETTTGAINLPTTGANNLPVAINLPTTGVVNLPTTGIQPSNQVNPNESIIIIENENDLPDIQTHQFRPSGYRSMLKIFLEALSQLDMTITRKDNNNSDTNAENINRIQETPTDVIPGRTGEGSQSRRKQKNKTHTSVTESNNTNTESRLEANNRITLETSSGRNIGDCPICLEPLSTKSICSTICGHIFCMDCIQRSVTTSKRCPTCRKILKRNGYHQIFL